MRHAPAPQGRGAGPLWWAALAGMLALSYALFYHLCQLPSSDISIHATWAAEGDFADPVSFVRHGAHPMWHVLVSLLLHAGMGLEAAAALVTALTKGAQLWLVRRLFSESLAERMSLNALTGLSVVCVTVSCLCVPWYNPTVYLGVGTPNTWHSSTQLIAMAFMLACVPLTARLYDRFEARLPALGEKTLLPWREPALLGVLLFLSLLAKPTFMQAFLPAACLFFLVKWIRHPQNGRFFGQVIACVLPSVAFMVLQYMYYFGIIVPSQGSMVLDVSFAKIGETLVRVVLMQAFPLYAFIACSKRGTRGTLFWLTLAFNIVSIVEFMALGESGRRAADGNFGWGMMGAAMMSWAVGIMVFFRAFADETRPLRGLRYPVGLALLGWHVASGVYYVYYLFTSGLAL